MKKILSVALIAALVVSSAFAGLSGQAKLNLGYNTKTGAYGFSNGKSFSVAVDVAEETNEVVAEGNVFAGIKATMVLKAADRYGDNAKIYSNTSAVGLGVILNLKEAYVAGEDWKLSITGTQSGPDFAASAIDSVFDDWAYDSFDNQDKSADSAEYVAKSYAVSVNKAPGFTATYKDWKVALGFAGGKADSETGAPDYFNYHASVFTPAIEVAEGFTLKAAAVASGIKNATKSVTVKELKEEKDDNGKPVSVIKTSTKKVYAEEKNFDAFGGSVEAAYASDSFSGKLAADFGMAKTVGTDKYVLGLDVAANAVVSGFTVDAYYQYGEKTQWVYAQVKGDLNEFDVPVIVKVYGKNILDDKNGQELGGEVSATFDAFTVTAGGSYTLSSKKLGVSGSVKYAAEKFTAKAGADFIKYLVDNGTKQLYANASIESDSIIPGATLKLAYGPTYVSSEDKTYSYADTNLLNGDAAKYGQVNASCTIKF